MESGDASTGPGAAPIVFDVLARPAEPAAVSRSEAVLRAALVTLVAAPDGFALFLLLRVAPDAAWGLYWTVGVVPMAVGLIAMAASLWPDRRHAELVVAAMAATVLGVGVRVVWAMAGRL